MITTVKSLNNRLIIDVSLCCLGFMIFSLSLRADFPATIISLAGLSLSGYIISREITSWRDFAKVFGVTAPRGIMLYLIIGLQLGLIYSIIYRNIFAMPVLPRSIYPFAIVAAFIGAAEELTFRGFIQGHAGKIHLAFGVLFASFAHAAYKCCLFIVPANNFEFNIAHLFLITFLGGVFFGLLKEVSKSVLPAMAAHIIFDILVYGPLLGAPWWVW